MKRSIKNLASGFIIAAMLALPVMAKASETVWLPIAINGQVQTLEAYQRPAMPPTFKDYTSTVRAYATAQDAQIAAIRASKVTTETIALNMEFGDMRATNESAIGKVKHLKSGDIPCVTITAQTGNLVVSGTGCYATGQTIDTTTPDDTYNDTYNAVNQLIELYNPNPAQYWVWLTK